MMWGKLIGALLGFMALKFPGLIIGLIIGHLFDSGMADIVKNGVNNHSREALQRLFLQLIFTTFGRLAKADGRVCEDEIAHTEALIKQFRMTQQGREQAIAWFKQGIEDEYSYVKLLERFAVETRFKPQLRKTLIELVVSIALADGHLHPGEAEILKQVATRLGVPANMFDFMLEQLKAQESFQHHQSGTASSSKNHLDEAYKALGVSSSASDAEVKKAYRKLMSEHHPDKLIAKGVPEEAVQKATERSQVIQSAYDLIKKSRKN